MPVASYFVNFGEPKKPRYTWVLGEFGPRTPPFILADDELQQARDRLKTTSRELDGFYAAQKQCAADKNFDAAKYYKHLIQEWTKQQRAWRLVLGFFVDETALPYRPMQYWPVELADYCDAVFRAIEFIRYGSPVPL